MSGEQDKLSGYKLFSERLGYQLPKPLQLEYLSEDLREDICHIIQETIANEYVVLEREFYQSEISDEEYWEERYHYNEFLIHVLWTLTTKSKLKLPKGPEDRMDAIMEIILKREFNIVLDIMELIINAEWMKNKKRIYETFITLIKKALDLHNAAYQIDANKSPCLFYPRVSKEQGDATEKAIETMYENGMEGAVDYLREAAEHLNSQKYISSIIESFKAVESVAHHISPYPKKSLGEILGLLRRKHGFFKHHAFAEASEKLADAMSGFYGWASQEARHASETGASNVAVNEAVTMFGMCASYSAYLINRHNEIEEQKSNEE